MKKRNKLSLLGLIIILVLGPLAYFRFIKPKSTSATWYATSGWYYRKALTIDYTKVSGGANLDSFPVLVSITDGGLKTNAQESGNDIMFTSSNGTTKLDHEIEKYTSSTGTLVAWVRIPTLSYTANTVIYMYYGNPGATDQSNKNAVWDASYVGVWHLAETSGHHIDSKGLQADSTAEGEISRTASGKANGAVLYNATGGAISIPTSTDLNLTTNLTVEAWIRVDGPPIPGNSLTVMQKCSEAGCSTSPYKTYEMDITAGNAVCFYLKTSGENTYNCTDALTYGNWYYITASAQVATNITNAKIYQNGLQIGGTASAAGATITSTRDLFFGDSGWGDPFNGIIDEVRFSKAVRTDGWIVTTYNTINSPSTFFSKGTEEKSKDPVAYWKFDEGQGTIAYDATSSKNNGTITGAVWKSEDLCVSGKCLYFDGSADNVSISSSIVLAPNPGFTFSHWLRTASTGNQVYTLGNTAGGNGYRFGIDAGKVAFLIGNASNYSEKTCGTTTVNDNKWHLITGVFGSTSLTCFIDGRLEATVAYDDGEDYTDMSTSAPGIGAPPCCTDFQGFIDDVKMYPYVRTAAEVKSDYNAGKAHASSIKGSSASLGNNNKNSEAFSEGLVGYWKMEENTGTTTADASGNGNTATFGVGNSAPAWSSGMYGVGLSFAGTQQYVEGNISNLPTTGNGTFSFWAKNNGTTSGAAISFQKADGNDNYLNIYPYSSGTIVLSAAWKSWVLDNTGVSSLSNGQWGHYTFVADTSTLYLYLNGSKIWSSPRTTSPGAPVKFRFGNRYWNNAPYAGTVDEVRIYNRALSPAEVQQLYNWAPGPVTCWNFEENTGSIAYDTCGTSNGTLEDNNIADGGEASVTTLPKWAAGKYGGGLKFDGHDDHVINDGGTTGIAGIKNGTAMFWVKPLGRGYSSGNNQEGKLLVSGKPLIYGTGAISVYWPDASTEYQGGFDLPDNVWTHVALAWENAGSGSANGNVYWYQNGTLAKTLTGLTLPVGTDEYLEAGQYWGVSPLNGLLDEIKIYNYARSAKQIVEDMNAGLALRSGSVGGASGGGIVAYYKFDEGYGTTINNSGNSGSTLNGNLGTGTSTPSWDNNGKFGKALSFDGGDYITIPYNSSLQPESFTISAWIKKTGDGGANPRIVGKPLQEGTWNDPYIQYELLLNNGTNPYAYINSGGSLEELDSNLSINTNQWYHLALSFDDNTKRLSIYVDGMKRNSNVESSSLQYSNNTNFYIGAEHEGANYIDNFQGLIDEVKIYNYALTDEEIKIDYNHGSAIVFGSTSVNTGNTASINASSQEYCVPGDTATCSSPVALWKFEEGVGSSAYDTSGNGNTGTLGTGNSAPTWATGKYGKALKFDGVNDYVATKDINSLDSASAFTIAGWAKQNTLDVDAPLWSKDNGVNTRIDFVTWNDGLFYVDFGTGTAYIEASFDYSSVVSSNTWFHYSVVFDGSATGDSNKLKVYINGKSQSLSYNGTIPTTTTDMGSSVFNIGTWARSAKYWNGQIDDVRIYNYARTPAQVAWDYNRGKPVSYWKLDECQGTSANDSSGNGNTGTITIGASGSQNTTGSCTLGVGQSAAWGNGATGKFNSSLNFDGTDDYVGISNTSSFNLTSFTLSLWWNANTLLSGDPDSYAGPFNNRISNQNGFQFVNDISSTTSFVPHLVIWNGTSETAHFKATTSYSLPFNEWRHFIWTYDGSTAKLYVNGQQISITTSAVTNYPKTGVIIGYGYGHATGKIDDVKIFNYALTATQIKILYNEGGAVRFGPLTGSP